MLQKIGLGFLTFIGVSCVIFGIMALQESNGGEAFLYFVIGIPCVVPLIIILVALGEDKMEQERCKNERDEFYQYLSSSSGAKTIVRHCREIKNGEDIIIVRDEVRITIPGYTMETFRLNRPLRSDQIRLFSIWLYNQINLPEYIITPMSGCPSSTPTGFMENSGGGYSFTYDRSSGSDVYGYRIWRGGRSSNTQQRITL